MNTHPFTLNNRDHHLGDKHQGRRCARLIGYGVDGRWRCSGLVALSPSIITKQEQLDV
ncbi:MAG: hypothetical protein VYA55_22840 [Pseudomonadota bacterium]|nr:hypothetical protein [Pseudomonadota bacterium]